jgi:sulfotransferase family protein
MNPSGIDLQFIGVSGIGNTGKSALVEMLKETESIKVFDRFFEFDIVRVPGGILDLYHHLCEAWSPIRSDYAIKEFLRLVYTMGLDPRWYDLIGLARSSSRYQRVFKGHFISESLAYINNFVKFKYHGFWPYDLLTTSMLERLARKIANRLTFERAFHFEINVADANDFITRTHDYLANLYKWTFEKPYKAVVLSNAIEPYNATRTLDILRNTKLLLVLRDPRDIYISAVDPKKMQGRDNTLVAIENKGGSKSFLPTSDIELFAKRQKVLMEKLGNVASDPRVLSVWFEDLVLEYESTRTKVFDFLGISKDEHIRQRTLFRPDISKNYVFLWKNYSRQEEVRYLEEELKQYLYRPARSAVRSGDLD